MANKPWFQANIHAPGTGFALLVIAICMVAQTVPMTICMAAPNKWGETLLRNPPHWGTPFSPTRFRRCTGGESDGY